MCLVSAYADGNSFQPFYPFKSNAFQRLESCGVYAYGWPAGVGCNPQEPNVVLQVLFDEPSGSIYDEVTGYEIPVADIVPTILLPTYGIEATGDWSGMSPGIYCEQNASTPACFAKRTATTEWNITTNDVTIEWVVSIPASPKDPSIPYHWSISSDGSPTDFGVLVYDSNTTTVNVVFRTDDEHATNATFTTAARWGAGYLKYRVVFDRDWETPKSVGLPSEEMDQ